MYKSVLKRKIIRFFVKPHVKTTFLPWNSEILKKYQKSFYSLTWHAKIMKVDTSTSNKLAIVTDINMVNSNSMDIDSGVDVPEEKRHTKNHAKWSVSVDGEVVCLGDLNHDSTQLNRGGMIICFENKTVGQYFLGLVNNP